MLFPLFNAFFSGILTLVLATVIFGLPLAATSFSAIPVAVIGVIAFMPFALVLVAMVTGVQAGRERKPVHRLRHSDRRRPLLPDRGAAGMDPLGVRSPAFHPRRRPAAPFLGGRPAGAPRQPWSCIKLVAFSAVLLPAAFMLLRASIRRGQITGTIAEY